MFKFIIVTMATLFFYSVISMYWREGAGTWFEAFKHPVSYRIVAAVVFWFCGWKLIKD